ncbi:hypothetical protein EV126DRAFT_179675 [Verticillium dahliae]|nr:hypothetical protein EV126DRAFT_179675 [Verticillium dahliae]
MLAPMRKKVASWAWVQAPGVLLAPGYMGYIRPQRLGTDGPRIGHRRRRQQQEPPTSPASPSTAACPPGGGWECSSRCLPDRGVQSTSVNRAKQAIPHGQAYNDTSVLLRLRTLQQCSGVQTLRLAHTPRLPPLFAPPSEDGCQRAHRIIWCG